MFKDKIMKNKIKKLINFLFLAFLIFYFITMLLHAREIDINLFGITLFILGIILAILAHAKKNYITIVLILVHMSIEWFEWSQSSFSISEAILNFGHILMDFVFLTHELTAHLRKHRYKILATVSFILISIFGFSKYFLTGNETVENIVTTIEPFVIGGVLGCISSHLFYHIKKFFTKEKCCEH